MLCGRQRIRQAGGAGGRAPLLPLARAPLLTLVLRHFLRLRLGLLPLLAVAATGRHKVDKVTPLQRIHRSRPLHGRLIPLGCCCALRPSPAAAKVLAGRRPRVPCAALPGGCTVVEHRARVGAGPQPLVNVLKDELQLIGGQACLRHLVRWRGRRRVGGMRQGAAVPRHEVRIHARLVVQAALLPLQEQEPNVRSVRSMLKLV
mmetsp:Transcript_41473/g.104268  ORF Transcript_41473/g.104268 Transcript_41473/m.104268 type:complete len:203 (+) Transcript_41473:1271-1879(+)